MTLFCCINTVVAYISTSLNPVLNAQVCVFDGTYYKITITNYIFKTSLYTTFCMYSLGPWLLKILMSALFVTREIATYILYVIPNQESTRSGSKILDTFKYPVGGVSL